MRIWMRDGSSLVRPMSNLTISYCALNSMILSKIADRWPESIRCPSASIVSLAAMGAHSSGTVRVFLDSGLGIRDSGFGIRDSGFGIRRLRDSKVQMARRAVVRLGIPALIVAALAVVALWRVGPPPKETTTAVGTAGTSAEKAITTPVKTIAELLSNNSVGREASLEHVMI